MGNVYEFLSIQAHNLSGDIAGSIVTNKPYLIAAMAMIPAAYGIVHIGALRLKFPSPVERLLWKISCY